MCSLTSFRVVNSVGLQPTPSRKLRLLAGRPALTHTSFAGVSPPFFWGKKKQKTLIFKPKIVRCTIFSIEFWSNEAVC